MLNEENVVLTRRDSFNSESGQVDTKYMPVYEDTQEEELDLSVDINIDPSDLDIKPDEAHSQPFSSMPVIFMIKDLDHEEKKQIPFVVVPFDYSVSGRNWAEGCCGIRQSPIDFVTKDCIESDHEFEAHFEDLENADLIYHHNALLVFYNKSTVKLKKDDAESTWKAIQFHFHAPSDHTVDSKHLDVELHFVYRNLEDPDQLLVVGVLFRACDLAESNKFIESLCLEELPKRQLEVNVRVAEFMETIIHTEKLNYSGSLTAPPCTENVEFFIIRKVVDIPHHQTHLFHRLWSLNQHFAGGLGSNREVQPLNNRVVYLVK